ncbi:MAG: IPT/TIG domain-containing protein, partial [Candidatus Symbiothrix sp.]|nr:IPT/TIG domain-containing protein [Candidatus Symbiothrix sp.]
KNNFSIPRSTGAGQWLSNGFQALDNGESFSNAGFPTTYPIDNASRTIEVIFRTPDAENMFEQKADTEGGSRHIFRYGGTDGTQTGDQFGVLYRGIKRAACGDVAADRWIFYAIFTNKNNMMVCLSSVPSLTTANTINTVTSTYQNTMDDPLTKSYINNTLATIVETGTLALNTGTNEIKIFSENISHATLLSVRLYNRVLTAEEIAKNAALDQIRFLAPPIVKIGDNQCTNVTVLSPRALTCKVPPIGGEPVGTPLNVEVRSADNQNSILTYYGEFTYTAPSAP